VIKITTQQRLKIFPTAGIMLLMLTFLSSSTSMAQTISVSDDLGRTIKLVKPAQRVISLAPHITENIFSAGAGNQLVGVVDYSNYPAQARQIASVGSYLHFSIETIIALRPDVVFAWSSGNGMDKINKLIELGLTVYISEPKTLASIANDIDNYGKLTGNEKVSSQVSESYRQKLASLQNQYSELTPVTVFYQVWNKPLQTLNGQHLISQVINLCGGVNVFSDVIALAPTVNIEAVLALNPQVIVASGVGETRPEWLNEWLQWPSITAVQQQQLYFIAPDYLQRHTVRILLGAEIMCEQLAKSRVDNRQKDKVQ
jgi:iron complex transport system substrate-binding protein